MDPLELETLNIPLLHLMGPVVPELLEQSGYVLPGVMSVKVMAKGFIARPGLNEFLISADDIGTPGHEQAWCYTRADTVLTLKGDGWRIAMSQICHMDLSRFKQGDWLMVSAAGINLWCIGLSNGLMLGCDPSLGTYLLETLTEIVSELNETHATYERSNL